MIGVRCESSNALIEEHRAIDTGSNGEELPTLWSDPFGKKDFKVLRKTLPQLSVSVFAYFGGVYINSLSQAWLQKNLGGYYDQHKELDLWDFGYHNFPTFDMVFESVRFGKWSFVLNWPDLMAGLPTILMVIRFLVVPGPCSMRWVILRRLLTLSGVMFFLRAFSIVSTVLPNPDHTCVCRIGDDPCTKEDLANIWLFAWQVFIMTAVTCTDVLFSGHTVALTMSLMFLAKYSGMAPWFPVTLHAQQHTRIPTTCTLNVVCMVFGIVGYSIIIGSRFHYTADVLLGFVLTLLVFHGYHQAIKAAFIGSQKYHSRAIRWFEEDALDMRVWCKLARRRMEVLRGIDQECLKDIGRDLISEGYDLPSAVIQGIWRARESFGIEGWRARAW